MHRFKETPADLMAMSSLFSAIFPKVMMDDSKIDMGSAMGTKRAVA